MCQIRPHIHQPCGCKSHQLRLCHTYNQSTQFHPQPEPSINPPSQPPNPSPSPHPPTFHTTTSKTFNPPTSPLSTCPSYTLHPTIIDAHPCPDHWSMLAEDARLFFGPPRGAAATGGEDKSTRGSSASVMTRKGVAVDTMSRSRKREGEKGDEYRDGDGGDKACLPTTTTATTIIENVNAPDPLQRRDHLDILRERYSALRGGGERARRVAGGGTGAGAGGGEERHYQTPDAGGVGGWSFFDLVAGWWGG